LTRAEALRRLNFARRYTPYTLAFAIVLPIPGVLAVVYGDAVSRALENISAGSTSRLMGSALLLGPLITLVGIIRGRTFAEAIGLTIMAAGCVIYGLGVILGLGLAGAVAGTGFLAIAIGTVLRIITLAVTAHNLNDGDE
jgi:hypothetical protein